MNKLCNINGINNGLIFRIKETFYQSQTIYFDTPFPNKCFIVLIQDVTAAKNGVLGIYSIINESITKDKFEFKTNYSTGANNDVIAYLAIGY